MEEDIEKLLSGDIGALNSFNENASKIFHFPPLIDTNKRKKLWEFLYQTVSSTADIEVKINCFSAIRILSREKTNLNELASEGFLNLIKCECHLNDQQHIFNENDTKVAVEAEKCLCNVVFNSIVAATLSCQNGILKGIVERTGKIKDANFPDDLKFFDMKLLFLLTALCPEIRYKVKEDYKGVDNLIEGLEVILRQAAEAIPQDNDVTKIGLNDKQVDLVCEILKALFNLTLNLDGNDESELERCNNLVSILRMYLLIPTKSSDKTNILQNNVINLLTNVPTNSYKKLLTPIVDDQHISNKFEFEGENMTAIYEMLVFLKSKFSDEVTVTKQHEVLSPIMSVLLKSANGNRVIRKYLRLQILPPLKDVHTRPEQGNTLRNHLCRLLTTPITQLRDLVAELLFVLCKKSVNRMIKYTGYGNAAGLFAQRGLLGGKPDEGAADFSPDEDSETEEYSEYKHGINPVIGCYEEPRPSAMENMSDEQKEYEAMKLVELMDNLTKSGAIKPCRIGPDGKPQPIEHVLQLREGLKSQQIHKNDSDESD